MCHGLDHCISNVEGYGKISSMEILYSCTGSDHFCLSMCVECSSHITNKTLFRYINIQRTTDLVGMIFVRRLTVRKEKPF